MTIEKNQGTEEMVVATIQSETNKSLREKRVEDYLEEGEKIPIGSLVCTYAHPFTNFNRDVLITNYLSFTPPIMIVSEKKYGARYDSITGAKDEDSYKCFYYSTASGTIEENWFRRNELKFIDTGDNNFFMDNKSNSLDKLKRDYVGHMAIMSNVDIELEKKKIWSDSDGELEKLKVNNLLDYLPPLGTIIDFKFNDDYQKYNEKEGNISHRKSKIMVKLRWLNNTTAKYSEEYFPIVGLKLLKKEKFALVDYKSTFYYSIFENIPLEGSTSIKVLKSALKFYDVIWKHYFYTYRFKDLFTGQLRSFKQRDLDKISEISEVTPAVLEYIFKGTDFAHGKSLEFFKASNKDSFEKKWFEIEYSDRSDRYTKRIIYVDTFEEEKVDIEGGELKRSLLKCNCLLRGGQIRHFNVSRIKSYRELPSQFVSFFVSTVKK